MSNSINVYLGEYLDVDLNLDLDLDLDLDVW